MESLVFQVQSRERSIAKIGDVKHILEVKFDLAHLVFGFINS